MTHEGGKHPRREGLSISHILPGGVITNTYGPHIVLCMLSMAISFRVFACLFAENAKTTARIDAKHSGITKNNPESVLCRLKLPVFLLSRRYHEISVFSFAAGRHSCKINHYMHACLHTITLKHCHIVAMGMTLLQLLNSLLST